MKRRIRILALLLVLALALTGCSHVPFAEFLAENGAAAPRTKMVSFPEMEYQRPDMESLQAQFTKAAAMLTDGSTINEVVTQLNTCFTEYRKFYTMDILSGIRSDQDVTDSYYAEEYAFCEDKIGEVEQIAEALYIACAKSSMKQALEKQFYGEGFLDNYLDEDFNQMDDTLVQLFRQESDLLQKYRSEIADPTVTYQGAECAVRNLMAEENLSEEAYLEISGLYYDKYSQVLGEIYIDLVAVRQEIAAYLGFDSYEAYAYLAYYNRDYTPEEATALTQEIRTYLTPVYKELIPRFYADATQMEQPLDKEALLSQLSDAAAAMGGSIKEAYDFMVQYELYDIDVSDKKADTSYQDYLSAYEAPYVFVKTLGYDRDLFSFGHEFGHFVDAYVNYNATSSVELTEVFSLGMEYLLLSCVDESRQQDMTRWKLLDTLDTYVQQASFSDFERQVYSIPAEELTVETLNTLSLQCSQDYGYCVEGQEEYYAKSWIDITHFFEYPFYVISYCVSSDAAFQIYQLELQEAGGGLAQFNTMLPRDCEGFIDTIVGQGKLKSPFEEGRMEETAALISASFH